MKTFKFTIKDNFFPQVFEGEQQASSKEELYSILVEDYTMLLDTEESELTITITEL